MAKSSNAEQRKFLNKADDHKKAIITILQGLSRTHGIDRTWSAWVDWRCDIISNRQRQRDQYDSPFLWWSLDDD